MPERSYFETTHIGMPRLFVLTDRERTTLTTVLREWRERLWKRGALSADSYVEAAQRHDAIVKSVEVH